MGAPLSGGRRCGNRSSRPHRLYRPTAPALIEHVEALRRQRWTSCRIACETQLSPATVRRILQRLGIGRLRNLDPPPRRYEHACPGALLHLDIKKLGRFDSIGHHIHGVRRQHVRNGGWEYVHVAINDHSRIAFSRSLRTNREFRRRLSWKRRWPAMRAWASRCGAYSPTMDHAINRAPFAKYVNNTGSSTYARGPTRRAPTAKPSVLSTLCGSGPTVAPITPRKNAPPIFRAGSMPTIGTALMPISAALHASLVPASTETRVDT